MGIEISNYVKTLRDYKIIAGIDKKQDINKILNYKVYNNIKEMIDNNIIADVVIDFSHPSALGMALEISKTIAAPLVLGTTGIDDLKKREIIKTSKLIPVFWSANMALGVNILANVCKYIVNESNDAFEIDIIEKHHNKKIDSPSGTANMIAGVIKRESKKIYGAEKIIISDNYKLDEERNKEEIRIYSLRSGNISGEHTVMFTSEDEILTVSHVASSKTVFAKGAIRAVNYIIRKKPGLYGVMS